MTNQLFSTVYYIDEALKDNPSGHIYFYGGKYMKEKVNYLIEIINNNKDDYSVIGLNFNNITNRAQI